MSFADRLLARARGTDDRGLRPPVTPLETLAATDVPGESFERVTERPVPRPSAPPAAVPARTAPRDHVRQPALETAPRLEPRSVVMPAVLPESPSRPTQPRSPVQERGPTQGQDATAVSPVPPGSRSAEPAPDGAVSEQRVHRARPSPPLEPSTSAAAPSPAPDVPDRVDHPAPPLVSSVLEPAMRTVPPAPAVPQSAERERTAEAPTGQTVRIDIGRLVVNAPLSQPAPRRTSARRVRSTTIDAYFDERRGR